MDLEQLVTFRVSRLSDTLTRAASLVYGRHFGLSITAWRTLAILSHYEPTTAMDISRRSHIDKGWISRSVAQLEERGLLRRAPKVGDNRSVLLSLTDQGRQMVAKVAPVSKQRHERVLAVLDEEERERFLQALDRIQERVDEILKEAETQPASQLTAPRSPGRRIGGGQG